MKRMAVFLATLVIGLSWAAAETKRRAATDEASRPASADTLMKAPVDLSQVSMTNPVKALADRVRGHVNSQPLRFPISTGLDYPMTLLPEARAANALDKNNKK